MRAEVSTRVCRSATAVQQVLVSLHLLRKRLAFEGRKASTDVRALALARVERRESRAVATRPAGLFPGATAGLPCSVLRCTWRAHNLRMSRRQCGTAHWQALRLTELHCPAKLIYGVGCRGVAFST